MAKAEVSVTVEANTQPLEKGLNDVTKEASKGGKGAKAEAGGFVSTLGKAYGQFSMIFSAIQAGFEFVMKYATMARELRNLSVATGLPVGQLREFELQAKQAGISTSTMAHSVAEFNKKMGEAKIRGSEANAAMAKLGVGLGDIQNGTFKYNDALMALAASYEAGTDDATLMYYGTQLFGSSFEQLLPLVKQGTVELKKHGEAMIGVNKNANNALSNMADAWDNIVQSTENALINIFGSIGSVIGDVLDLINNGVDAVYQKVFSSTDKDAGEQFAQDVFDQMSKGLTKAQQQNYFEKYGSLLNYEQRKSYDQKIKELTESKGKKLTPLGLSEAQGASSIQQMGGGDIVSAIAFTPLERIAMATEETARNTDPKNNKPEPQDLSPYFGYVKF